MVDWRRASRLRSYIVKAAERALTGIAGRSAVHNHGGKGGDEGSSGLKGMVALLQIRPGIAVHFPTSPFTDATDRVRLSYCSMNLLMRPSMGFVRRSFPRVLPAEPRERSSSRGVHTSQGQGPAIRRIGGAQRTPFRPMSPVL